MIKELLFLNNYALAFCSLGIPLMLATMISTANLSAGAGIKKLLVFYAALFAGIIASVFGNSLAAGDGEFGFVTGLVIGTFAGAYAGDSAAGRIPSDPIYLSRNKNFIIGGLAGGLTGGMFASRVMENGLLSHYLLLLLVVVAISFLIAKLKKFVLEWFVLKLMGF